LLLYFDFSPLSTSAAEIISKRSRRVVALAAYLIHIDWHSPWSLNVHWNIISYESISVSFIRLRPFFDPILFFLSDIIEFTFWSSSQVHVEASFLRKLHHLIWKLLPTLSFDQIVHEYLWRWEPWPWKILLRKWHYSRISYEDMIMHLIIAIQIEFFLVIVVLIH
jgi:hypothetical protein